MLQPPALHGIIALCCSHNRYLHDVHYAGGCLITDNIAWSGFMTTLLALPPDPAMLPSSPQANKLWLDRVTNVRPWLSTWLQHQWYDEYWKHGSLCEDWSAIQCSMLVASGWADGYRDMVPAVLENIRLPEGKIVKGINGPWAHNLPQ
jgi:predicted acyl esterase